MARERGQACFTFVAAMLALPVRQRCLTIAAVEEATPKNRDDGNPTSGLSTPKNHSRTLSGSPPLLQRTHGGGVVLEDCVKVTLLSGQQHDFITRDKRTGDLLAAIAREFNVTTSQITLIRKDSTVITYDDNIDCPEVTVAIKHRTAMFCMLVSKN